MQRNGPRLFAFQLARGGTGGIFTGTMLTAPAGICCLAPLHLLLQARLQCSGWRVTAAVQWCPVLTC